MFKKIRIDFNKNTKFFYYIKNIFRALTPSLFFRLQRKRMIQNALTDPYIQKRVAYYNKLSISTSLDQEVVSIRKFFFCEKKKTYFFDLLYYLKYFSPKLKMSYLFGDITHIPKTPSFVKSRPIQGENANSILFKLNKIRHFVFVNDKVSFEEKKDMLVWRGKTVNELRKTFVQEHYANPICNVGQVNTRGDLSVPWQKKRMSLSEQLQYKFILSLEGNDVASNLKWIMSSNSLVFMPQPQYETWFMEGTLKPDFHYVLLKDDLSDLEEKIQYYTQHVDEAKEIVKNANNYVLEFQNPQREHMIALCVLEKYFQLTSQVS